MLPQNKIFVDAMPVGQAMCSIVRKYDALGLIFLGMFDCGIGVHNKQIGIVTVDQIREYMQSRADRTQMPDIRYYMDLFVISHVDADHVNLVEKLFRGLPTEPERVATECEVAPDGSSIFTLTTVTTIRFPCISGIEGIIRELQFEIRDAECLSVSTPDHLTCITCTEYADTCTVMDSFRDDNNIELMAHLFVQNTYDAILPETLKRLSWNGITTYFWPHDLEQIEESSNDSVSIDASIEMSLADYDDHSVREGITFKVSVMDQDNYKLFSLLIKMDGLRDCAVTAQCKFYTKNPPYPPQQITIQNNEINLVLSQQYTPCFPDHNRVQVADTAIDFGSFAEVALCTKMTTFKVTPRLDGDINIADLFAAFGLRLDDTTGTIGELIDYFKLQNIYIELSPKNGCKIDLRTLLKLIMAYYNFYITPFTHTHDKFFDLILQEIEGSAIRIVGTFREGSPLTAPARPSELCNVYNQAKASYVNPTSADGKTKCIINDLIIGGPFIYDNNKNYLFGKKPSATNKKIYNLLVQFCHCPYVTDMATKIQRIYNDAQITVNVMPFTLPIHINTAGLITTTTTFSPGDGGDCLFFHLNMLQSANLANSTSLLASVATYDEQFNFNVIATFPGDATFQTMFYVCSVLNTPNPFDYASELITLFTNAHLMQAPHHGSLPTARDPKSSETTVAELYIRTLSPQKIVISAGHNSSYGHPQLEMMQIFMRYLVGRNPPPGPEGPHLCYYNTTNFATGMKTVHPGSFGLAPTNMPIFTTVGAYHSNPSSLAVTSPAHIQWVEYDPTLSTSSLVFCYNTLRLHIPTENPSSSTLYIIPMREPNPLSDKGAVSVMGDLEQMLTAPVTAPVAAPAPFLTE